MIDGVHFGDHLGVLLLGVGIDAPSTRSAWSKGQPRTPPVITDLLRDRGRDTSRPVFVGIDGGKALRAAVVRVFDHQVIQRCQRHNLRNVANKLLDRLAEAVTRRMRARPTMPTGRSWPRPRSRRWPRSSTALTLAPPPASVSGWPRR